VCSGKKWRRSDLKVEGRTEDCYLADKFEGDKMGRTCSKLWASEKTPHFMCKLEDIGAARRW
jgi:hypothetical protein